MFSLQKKNAKLILSDGSQYLGVSIGKPGTVIGEIVFNTSMVGYFEIITDASYYGQIVVQTFPLIGNYGVDVSSAQSEKPWLSGYILKDCYEQTSIANKQSLRQWLLKNNVVAIKDIDTRHLTKKIRDKGVMNGAITTQNIKDMDSFIKKIKEFKIKNAIAKVSTKNKVTIHGSGEDFLICVLDFGVKKNILKILQTLVNQIILMPYNTTKQQIEKIKPDGILLSNGPGDPAFYEDIIENIKDIQKLNIPIFGVCMGHQLLAIANGAKTAKLKYGHRGANQPVLDLKLKKIFIAAQNHGYFVEPGSINSDIAFMSYINPNDNTTQGIEYKSIPAFSVQFHPEGACGPRDTIFLFKKFIDLIKKHKFKKEAK